MNGRIISQANGLPLNYYSSPGGQVLVRTKGFGQEPQSFVCSAAELPSNTRQPSPASCTSTLNSILRRSSHRITITALPIASSRKGGDKYASAQSSHSFIQLIFSVSDQLSLLLYSTIMLPLIRCPIFAVVHRRTVP